MWTRAQLKEKAKYTFKLNYWKVVIVTLLVALISGGLASGSGAEIKLEDNELSFTEDNYFEDEDIWGGDYDYSLDEDIFYNGDIYGDDFSIEDIYGEGFQEDMEEILGAMDGMGIAMFLLIFMIVFIVVLAIVLIVSLVWAAFIHNPIEVGSKRFFFKSLGEKAQVKEIAYAFDNNYKNVATVMFYKTLYEMLWTLLFIIPGIVKAYEYRMIPYLLAENPNLTKEQAFAISKQMMDGQKWNAFVLDLSFIGWDILSACTMGILGIFYVEPYKNMTNAALYEELSLQNGRPALMEPVVPEYTYAGQETSYTAPEEN